jgi:hypothetical protein
MDMRKRQIVSTVQSVAPAHQARLDTYCNVRVDVTSEDKAYPIEFASLPDEDELWLACG